MKKALIISTIVDFQAAFEINNIKILQGMGYEVHCACNCKGYIDKIKVKELMDTGIVKHHVPFARSPLLKTNIVAWKALKKLIRDEHFALVHCHTPVGGALGRMAAYRNHVPVIMYTAHGFHFYDGAPLKYWLIFYPIEMWLSRYTDVLITINREDYKRAKKKFHAGKTVYVPGVGVDTEKFRPRASGRERVRAELGLPKDRIMLLSVGELNKNKNHDSVIRAISGLENLTYVIVGKGELDDYLRKAASESGVDLRLSGFRNDVADFYDAADIYILPSIREGLNVSLMEAMAAGKPCVVSKIRGNADLVEEGKGGFLFCPGSEEDLRSKIYRLMTMPEEKIRSFGEHNFQKIQKFSGKAVEKKMRDIYKSFT